MALWRFVFVRNLACVAQRLKRQPRRAAVRAAGFLIDVIMGNVARSFFSCVKVGENFKVTFAPSYTGYDSRNIFTHVQVLR